MRVVADEGDRIIAFLAQRTPCKWTFVDFAGQKAGPPQDHLWERTQVLHIFEIGAWHGVRVFFDPETGAFRSWYIDLQMPNRRTPDGIVTQDCALDITADAELNWHWKDQQDFEQLLAMGWINASEADRLRVEAQRVIERLERRQSPFDEPWPEWRPDPAWSIPSLPSDWANLESTT
jgi:predicted RNA-binding protein associated with RNAse of E/G family